VGLASALLALTLSILLVGLVMPISKYRIVFEQLGMTKADLPLPTVCLLSLEGVALWILAGICVALAYLAWNGRLGNRGLKSVVIVWILAVAFPALAYVALEMPIVQIRDKLNDQDHQG
jgi:hypothetical protein